ncbi:MAG TPA: RsmD family RNA methyltransferase [Chitinophagaceae bacterium]|nr:RsmD family RNA methyltransferase [Chitinophagaceae bacterium]
MRIISGKLGGRRITPPRKMPYTRPTTDVAKEGLFNMLEHGFPLDGCKTLDLFGGTGCISYELASRGAENQTLIEKDNKQVRFIKKTAGELNIPLKVFKMDVFKFMERSKEQFDFIFAGPPYALKTIDQLPDLVFEYRLLNEDGWFVLEHTPDHNFDKHPYFDRKKNYGTTIFSIFILNK